MRLKSVGALLSLFVWTSVAAPAEKLPGPLFEGMGSLHHPVSTPSKKAQQYFNQGLTFAFAFNHKEAVRSFRSAAKVDPACAMAWWGVAYAFGPHVNKPMDATDTAEAWSALRKALELKAGVSAREQDYIDALAKRYQATFVEDRSSFDKAYANAMRELVKKYPDDLDAQTLFAEALMNTMPWDYWRGDLTPKPETEEVLAALKFVITRNPDHPGANHFYIHAVEAGPTPELALPSADRLRQFAPTAGHLVHMPSHIYLRVGQYHDASLANELAVKADEAYLRQMKAQGFYPGVYYPHNIHFLWHSLYFEGSSAASIRNAEKAAEFASENYCGPSKVLEAPRLRHLPWVTKARFGRWDEVLRIPQPSATNDFLIDRAMWHFARGLAFATRQQADHAAAEHAALIKLASSEEAKPLNSPIFPASGVLDVANHWLAGKVAGAKGDWSSAVTHLQKAVAAEKSLPYMEPAFWSFPVKPALGAALLQSGNAVEAEKVFRADLKDYPRNGWGLLGLETSLRQQGRNETADLVRQQFDNAWKHADVKLDLSWF